MDERLVEMVLRAVDLIPRGRVAAYGDLGRIVGIGPRQVGAVMSRYGDGVTWWRVTNASGGFAPDLLERARPHWLDEGILVRPSGVAAGSRSTGWTSNGWRGSGAGPWPTWQ